jgi:hypothetical protein
MSEPIHRVVEPVETTGVDRVVEPVETTEVVA